MIIHENGAVYDVLRTPSGTIVAQFVGTTKRVQMTSDKQSIQSTGVDDAEIVIRWERFDADANRYVRDGDTTAFSILVDGSPASIVPIDGEASIFVNSNASGTLRIVTVDDRPEVTNSMLEVLVV